MNNLVLKQTSQSLNNSLPNISAGNWECHAFAVAMLSFWGVVM